MPLEIVSRDKLLRLKSETDEVNRNMKNQQIIKDIHKKVTNAAKTYSVTRYEYPLYNPFPTNILPMIPPPLNKPGNKSPNVNELLEIADIVLGVQYVFPDSLVQYKILADTINGIRRDITGIVDTFGSGKPYIVIDWS